MTSQLQQFVARIERLEEEKKTISTDIGEIYKEAKANGFDTKILRKTIALRKKPAAERQEEAANIDMYMSALGANVGDVQTFTRKDGVKVTLERMADEKSVTELTDIAMQQICKEGGKSFTMDLTTGEITEHNSGAVAASSAPDTADGEGATSPSANPSADVIAIETEQASAAPVIAGKVTSAVPESDGVAPDALTEAVEDSPDLASTADPFDDLAIPEFLRRAPPPVAPLHRVLP